MPSAAQSNIAAYRLRFIAVIHGCQRKAFTHEVVSSTSDFCSQDSFRDAVVVVVFIVFILSILSLFLFSIVYSGSIHESFMTDSLSGEKKDSGLF